MLDSGEHVIGAAGEVHLSTVVKDLRERFARIELRVRGAAWGWQRGPAGQAVAGGQACGAGGGAGTWPCVLERDRSGGWLSVCVRGPQVSPPLVAYRESIFCAPEAPEGAPLGGLVRANRRASRLPPAQFCRAASHEPPPPVV